MIKNRFLFIFFAVLAFGCSISEKPDQDDNSDVKEVKNANPICFNHAVLVLDSATYYAALNSEFVRQFAFSEERQLNGYKGFYLFGKTNYLEFFHPKSFEGYEEEEGGIWICLASLKSNSLERLNQEKLDFIEYSLDDQYHNLSLALNDSIKPFTAWEMTQQFYESWTKKEFTNSMKFSPIDYNSQQDSDSSSNYWMNDLIGIGIRLNSKDRSKMIRYLKEIGFDNYTEINGLPRLSNGDQFFEFHSSEEVKSPKVTKYFIRLNHPVKATTETIGNSRIECDGTRAIWFFDN